MSEIFSMRNSGDHKTPEDSPAEHESTPEEIAQEWLMRALLRVNSGEVEMPGGNPARDPFYRFNYWLEFAESIASTGHRAEISRVITDAQENFNKRARAAAPGSTGEGEDEPSPDTVRGFLGAVAYRKMLEDEALRVAGMKGTLAAADYFAGQYGQGDKAIGLPGGPMINREDLISMTKIYSTRNAKQSPETPSL